MPIVTSGTLRMSGINTELGRTSTAQIALDLAENGSYAAINQNSTSRPSATNPATMSEWYGYNHTAAPPVTTGVWTTSVAMPVANCRAGGSGTPTAFRHVGGFGGATCNFSFNGTSWTTNTALPGAQNNLTAIGSQSSFMAISGTDNQGTNVGVGRIWNGSSWSNTSNLVNCRILFGAAGTPSAGLAWGGAFATASEAYNGSTWSARTNLTVGRCLMNGNVGSQSSALAVNTATANSCRTVEFYNGSAWSSASQSNVGRCQGMASGTSSGAVLFGGNVGGVIQTQSERYNGSTWSVTGSLNAARCIPTGGGDATTGYAAGGSSLSSTERISF